jgi:RNA polymerase sigma factor (sigma-70 family)
VSDEGLENLVRRAQLGEAAALEAVVAEVQDATQEVLIRLVTKLSTFRGESSFRTWVYRVAAHAILNFRGVLKLPERTFEESGALLEEALDRGERLELGPEADRETLVNEVKLVCTHGMLLCLDRPHRLAYVLGEILEFPGEEAAAILETTPEAFRKRLSRARDEMGAFLRRHCGLADPSNRCRCVRLLPTAMSLGAVDPDRPAYASLPTREADRLLVNIDRVRSGAEIFRSLPRHGSPVDFTETVRGWLRDLSDTRN